MNYDRVFSSSNRVRQALLFGICLVMSIATTSVLTGMQDIEDYVEKQGPELDLFQRDSIEASIAIWKWRSQLLEKQQELVADTQIEWDQRLLAIQEETSQIQEQLGQRGLSYPVDIRSIQRIDEDVRLLESELIGLEAKLKQLKAQATITETELKMEFVSKNNEIQLLQSKLAILTKEYQRLKELRNAGVASESQVSEIELRVTELESDLQISEKQLDVVRTRSNLEQSSMVQATAEQQVRVTDRLVELVAKKELLESLRPIQKIESLKHQSDMAMKMIEMIQTRRLTLRLENIRNLALIELAEHRLAEADAKSDREDKDD